MRARGRRWRAAQRHGGGNTQFAFYVNQVFRGSGKQKVSNRVLTVRPVVLGTEKVHGNLKA